MSPVVIDPRTNAIAPSTFFKLRMTSSCGLCSSDTRLPSFASPVRFPVSHDGLMKPLLRLA